MCNFYFKLQFDWFNSVVLTPVFQVYNRVIQLYIYMYLIFFKFILHLGYYKLLSRIPCAMQKVPI